MSYYVRVRSYSSIFHVEVTKIVWIRGHFTYKSCKRSFSWIAKNFSIPFYAVYVVIYLTWTSCYTHQPMWSSDIQISLVLTSLLWLFVSSSCWDLVVTLFSHVCIAHSCDPCCDLFVTLLRTRAGTCESTTLFESQIQNVMISNREIHLQLIVFMRRSASLWQLPSMMLSGCQGVIS